MTGRAGAQHLTAVPPGARSQARFLVRRCPLVRCQFARDRNRSEKGPARQLRRPISARPSSSIRARAEQAAQAVTRAARAWPLLRVCLAPSRRPRRERMRASDQREVSAPAQAHDPLTGSAVPGSGRRSRLVTPGRQCISTTTR